MRSYIGNIPEGDGWDELVEFREFYGSKWKVYVCDNDPAGKFLSIKLISNDYVDNKANYWFSWNVKENKICGRNKDHLLLKANRPELYQAALNILKLEYA